MKVKAVIFDMDGTLVDTNSLLVEKWKCYAEKMGFEVPTDEQILEKIGIPFEETTQLNWPGQDHDKKVFRKCQPETKISHIVKKKTLKKLKENYKIAIATSGHRDAVRHHMGELREEFKTIITADDTTKHKPNPEPLILCCERLGLDSDDVIYVGDTIHDKKAAEAAGIRFVGVTTGAMTPDAYKKLNVEYIKDVNHIEEVLGAVDGEGSN